MSKRIEDLNITESQKESLRRLANIRADTDKSAYTEAEESVVNEWLSRQGLDTDNGGSILG